MAVLVVVRDLGAVLWSGSTRTRKGAEGHVRHLSLLAKREGML